MNAPTLSGSIYGARQGGVPVRHAYRVSSTTSTTATSTGIVIKASADQPVLVEGQIIVTTADGGTSPTLSLGYTAAGYTDLVNAASTATAATGGTFLPASNATGKKLLTADTTIYYKQGGTPDGAGVTWLVFEVTPLNPR